MAEYAGESLQLALRRWSKNVELPAASQVMILAAAEIDRLEVVQESELTGDRVKVWLERRGLDVHPRQRGKFKQYLSDG